MSDPFVRARNGDTEFFKRVHVDRILNLRDEASRSVLSISVRCEHIQCTKVILQRCPSLLYQQSKYGCTVLHDAVCSGILAIVKLLIHGAEKRLFRMRDDWEDAPIMDAVSARQLEMVKLLIQADPDYEVPENIRGDTPLLFALRLSYGESSDDISVKIRRFLLEKQPSQCKVCARNRGWTALHYATDKGDLGAIKDIIEFCPDCVFVVDFAGDNFLHTAVVLERVHVVEYIVKEIEIEIFAALLNSKNEDGDTPLDIATKKGNRKIITCLQYAPTSAGYENEREKELCVPPKHFKLYRDLVRNFGEIVPPHLSMSLDEFLRIVFEMLYVTPETVTQQRISFWEKEVRCYASVGLQVNWLQTHVTQFRDWLAKKNENTSRLKNEIAAKEKERSRLEDEIAAKKKERSRLEDEIAAKEKERSRLEDDIAAKENECSRPHLDFGFGLFDE